MINLFISMIYVTIFIIGMDLNVKLTPKAPVPRSGPNTSSASSYNDDDKEKLDQVNPF